ncbi:MAG: hypothetical protein GY715_15620 [Planctomycetes bacterium]|nr:hypothetical protein [Planctomycetota bacterium]
MGHRTHILIGALLLAVLLRSQGGIEMPCFAHDEGAGHVHMHVHQLDGRVHAHVHHHHHDHHGTCSTHEPETDGTLPCVAADHDCDEHGHPSPASLVVLPRSRSDWSPATPTTLETPSTAVTPGPRRLAAREGHRATRCLGPPGAWADLHRRSTLLLI